MTNINDYMTPAEAAHRWGKSPESIKQRLNPARNKRLGDLISSGLVKSFKKPGGKRSEWIISREAMELWYGKEK